MKILCKFTSFLNFLFLEAAAAATVIKNKLPLPRRAATVMKNKLPLPRRYGHLWSRPSPVSSALKKSPNKHVLLYEIHSRTALFSLCDITLNRSTHKYKSILIIYPKLPNLLNPALSN
jgi:hypothetical protein